MVDLVKIRKKSKDAKAAELDEAAGHPDEQIDAAKGSAAEVAAPPAAPAPSSVAAPELEPEPAPKPPVELVAPAPPPAAKVEKPARKKPAAPVADTAAVEPAPAKAPPVAEPPAPVAPAPVVTSSASTAALPAAEPLDRLAEFKRMAGKRRNWSETKTVEGPEEAVRPEIELLRFKLAGENYAVDIEKIVEIVPPRTTTRVPNADESIVGIMSLRGTIVTVLDLRKKLGHPVAGGEDKDSRLVVVERAGETAGFLVDKVSRVIKLDPDELESHPVVNSAEQSDFVSGVFQSPDGLVILLDMEKILGA